MEKMYDRLDPEQIEPGNLSRKEIKEICKEINARNKGEGKPHEKAVKVDDAIRQEDEKARDTSIYPLEYNPFIVDMNRIKFSKAFQRLKLKTQSLTSPVSPHISDRLNHSLKVASVSRTIARALGLNEELTEAIALGHDLGHVPFGHDGELHLTAAMLNVRADILQVLGAFKHNIQSLHVVDRVETRTGFEKGRGLNLTDQVRHGILSHDGEKDNIYSAPRKPLLKNPALLQRDIKRYIRRIIEGSTFKGNEDAAQIQQENDLQALTMSMADKKKYYKEKESQCFNRAKEAFGNANKTSIKPGTLEAAVVAMVDVLTYAPQDFEDQVSLGIIRRKDLPFSIAKELGEDGASMINRLASDLMVHSYIAMEGERPRITYSKKIGDLVNRFKREFLYEQYPRVNSLAAVYGRDTRVRHAADDIQRKFNYLFQRFVDALEDPSKHKNSPVLDFMEGRNRFVYNSKMDDIYGKLPDEEAYIIASVMDFLAGFTDDFFFEKAQDMHV